MMTTAAGQVSDNLQHASNMLIMDRHYSADQLLQQQNTFLLRQKEFQIKELEIENERDRERERERERERVRADEEIERKERIKNREIRSRENEIRVSKQSRVSSDRGPNLESLGYEESSLSRMNGGGGMENRDGKAVSQSLFQKPNKRFSSSSDILQVEEEEEEEGDDYDDDRDSRISGDNPDGLDGYSIAFDIERSRMSTGFTGFTGLAETLPARKEISTSSNTAFSTSLDIPRERNWRDLRGFGGGDRGREGGGGGGGEGGGRVGGGGGGGGGRVLQAEHAHTQDKYHSNVSRSGSRIQNQDSEYSDTFEDENDNNEEEEDDDYYSRKASEVERRVKGEVKGEVEVEGEDEVEEDSGYISRSPNKFHSVGEKSRSLINDSVPYDVTYEEDFSEEDSGTEGFAPQSSSNQNISNSTGRSRSNKKNDVNRTSSKKGGTEGSDSGSKKKQKQQQRESHKTEEMNAGDSDSSGTYTTDSYTASDDKITTSFSPSAHLLLRNSSQSPPRYLFQNTGDNSDILRNQSSGSPDRRIQRCHNSFHSIPFHSSFLTNCFSFQLLHSIIFHPASWQYRPV